MNIGRLTTIGSVSPRLSTWQLVFSYKFIVNLLLLIAVYLFSLKQVTSTKGTMDSKAISSAITKFSTKFCSELKQDKGFVSSPLSAEYLLALLALGSADPSLTELLKALAFPDCDSIRTSFKSVLNEIKSVEGVELKVANKIYVQEGEYDLDPNLKEDAVNVFKADIEKLNMRDGAAAAKKINEWVEGKTNNKIKDLLKASSLDAQTRLVLVNALYFKGSWANKFDPKLTSAQPFHFNDVTKDVQMMYKESNFRYGESLDLNAQLLEIAYVGNKASMLVILPRDSNGLNALLKKLAGGHELQAELEKMRDCKVAVSLPKFRIETEIDLKELLPKVGIKSIFDMNNSGLTKLLTTKDSLYVSSAIQKAFIEVNEEGSEAAAATAMGIALCSLMVSFDPVQLFVADHPFLVVIMNKATGTPIFLGAYVGN